MLVDKQMLPEFFHVGAEKDKRRQAGRRDGVAFSDGLHRIADCIQFVGDGTDALRQVAHHGDSARVVRDRAEGIEGNDDP